MNTRDILNANLYPSVNTNVRRKSYPKYDTLPIATGQTDYYFFQTALGNNYLRNARLPLSGTEVFFIDSISLMLRVNVSTVALMNNFNEMMQQGFLQISVDNRIQCKLPLLDVMNYVLIDTFIATATVIQPMVYTKRRFLPLPIILNSTSSFEFKVVIPTASATAFNTVNMQLTCHGIQLDKLDSFYWDNLKQNQFQEVPVRNGRACATLVTKATAGAGSSDWTINGASIRPGQNEGRVVTSCGPAGSQTDVNTLSPDGLNDGLWHHVAWTRSADGLNRLYIDGEQVDENEDDGQSIVNDRPFQIGGDPHQKGAFFEGEIAEVAIYAAPLTAERVRAARCGGRCRLAADALALAAGAAGETGAGQRRQCTAGNGSHPKWLDAGTDAERWKPGGSQWKPRPASPPPSQWRGPMACGRKSSPDGPRPSPVLRRGRGWQRAFPLQYRIRPGQ